MRGTYAVIGDPIDHSLSPAMHNAAFRALKMDCSYIACRVRRGELRDGIASLGAAKIAGFNVTIPHKVEIMDLLDYIDPECVKVGACNTVSVREGRLEGHNTDMRGFLDPLERRGIDVSGSNTLVLGAGGAARAIVFGLVRKRARVTVAARSAEHARSISEMAERADGKIRTIPFSEAVLAAPGCEMIINATPIGMHSAQTPVPIDSITAGTTVYDIVYRPVMTALLAGALKRGATVVHGYEMLLSQATASFEIWHGTKPPYDEMKLAVLGAHAR